VSYPKRGEPGFHEAAASAFVDGFLSDITTINTGLITADTLYVEPTTTEGTD
jgi:hypothetical protein